MEEKRLPKVGVAAILIKDGKILMGRRKGAHGAGTWSVHGGHLEFNETWEECAVRETLEETGVKMRNPVFFAATNDIMRTEDKHYITIYVKGEYESGEPSITEPGKFVDVGWQDLDNLPKPYFEPLANLLKNTRLA